MRENIIITNTDNEQLNPFPALKTTDLVTPNNGNENDLGRNELIQNNRDASTLSIGFTKAEEQFSGSLEECFSDCPRSCPSL